MLASLAKLPQVGCDECRHWAMLKAAAGYPTAGDTYCATCGAREAEVSRAIKRATNRSK